AGNSQEELDEQLQDGLSCITGNCYVQFLGEKEAARPPTYPAANATVPVEEVDSLLFLSGKLVQIVGQPFFAQWHVLQ
ncbi:MAG: hypothetical protein ACYCYO_22035, partial [Bacilli bacterium]